MISTIRSMFALQCGYHNNSVYTVVHVMFYIYTTSCLGQDDRYVLDVGFISVTDKHFVRCANHSIIHLSPA